MLTNNAMLGPVVALVAWSLVMWLWMYATRLPAMLKSGMKPDPMLPVGQQMAELPARVRWKADNYNHLMEEPTIFYAVALALAVMGEGGELALYSAWAYVGIRVVHSLFQALINKIEVRFLIFALSNIPLILLTWIAGASILA
jgi:hypothetical protein